MATGATVEELLEQLIEATKAGSAAPDASPALGTLDIAEFRKQLKLTTDKMKEGLTHQKKLSMLMQGTIREHKDITDSLKALDSELEQLDEAVRHRASTMDDDVKRSEITAAKRNLVLDTAFRDAGATAHNFGIGVMGVAGTLANGVLTFAKGLQSNASGVDVGTQALIDGAKASGEAAGVAGSAISGMAGIVAGFLKGPWKYVAAGVGLAGEALGIFGKKAAEVSEKGITFLGDELKKTVKSYRDATDAGVVLGGGMTEMRQIAYDAGLSIDQLSTVVKASKEDIAMMGVGMGEATKRLTGVSRELRKSELGSQLRNLGYGIEEQTGLIAAYSARQRQAGDTRIQSDLEIAKGTAAYGRDLKVLADITGKDAKAAMEKAAEQAMEQDLMAEAMRKGGPEAMNKLRDQLATMPETMKKGYMEFVSTGGTAIADAATNVAITQNPKIMDQYKQMYSTLGDSNKKASDALDETGRLNEQTAKYAVDHNANSKEIAIASRFTGDALTRGATDIQNELTKVAARQGEGTTKKAREEVDKSAVNNAPLDKAVNDLEESAQSFKAALGKETTGAITNFADTLRKGAKSMEAALDELGLRKKSMTEKVGEVGGGIAGGVGGTAVGAAAGAIGGAIIGSVVPVIGTALGAGIGGALGGIVGGMAGGWLGSKAGGATGHAIVGSDNEYDNRQKPKMAAGGITQGQSIVGEAGPEAVVPLPNQKAIPVILNAGNLADQLTESLAKSQFKESQRGYGNQNTSYDDLPREMQSWIKTRMQYDSYKKMTEEPANSKTHVNVDPAHKAKMDSTPKYLEDQSAMLKEKYGRDIAQEYRDMQAKHIADLNEQQKKIYGDDINAYYSKLDGMTKMAKGGITKGPSIAGEAGPEAVIPLVGGAVPVTLIDKSFLMDGKKPDANFEEIKSIIRTAIPPVGMISKAVDFFTRPEEKQQDQLSGRDIDNFRRALNANINDKSFSVGKGGLADRAQDTTDQTMADLSRALNANINDKSLLVGKGGLADQTQGMADLSRALNANINDKSFSVGKGGLADRAQDSESNFKDMKRMVEIAMPPVGMISKAVDFFTKPVEKQQDPLSGADIAKALDANVNDKSSRLGTADLDKQMQPLMDRVAAMPDSAKYQAGGWEADRSMPKSGLSDTNFDTSKLLDAASPMLGMISKAISTLADNKNAPADTNKTNIDPGTDMGMGMGSKSINGAEATDALKELPGLLKAMISRSDDQLQELRATKNIQQQIANNY